MSRIARVVAAGLPHHITQRGNYQQDVFLSNDDRRQYLRWLQEYSLKYGLSILVYCLMQNHVHFIVIPKENNSLSKTFNTAHMRYAQYFNKKLRQRGHLWQGRFYSCVLDEPHLILASRYVERNPVRAGIVAEPWQWPWSSALVHTSKKEEGFIRLMDFTKIIDMSYDSWKKYIGSTDEESFLCAIRQNTLSGLPLGKEAFVGKLEENFGRILRALPMGRPRACEK
jgi:putative transposase